jgi:phage tail sheath gpL-like
MPASIVVTGVSADFPNPGDFVEVNYAQGSASGLSGTYAALIVANKLSSGAGVVDTTLYGPDTPVSIQSENDVIALAGAGSEAHRMYRAFTLINKRTPLYFIFPTESIGAQATRNVTLATTATGNGNLRIYVGGGLIPGEEFVDVPILLGEAPDAIKTKALDLVNARTYWPVTASSGGTGIITLTAKQRGPRGNDIVVQCAITAGIGMTVDTATRTVMAGGATADSNVNALATVLPMRFFYICSAANDTTQASAVSSQLGTQALPLNGIRQHAVFGSSGSVSTANTLSTTMNNARCGNIFQELSDYTPAEIAAHACAMIALEEAGKLPVPLHNFTFYGNTAETQPKWKIRAPRSLNSPTATEVESCLKSGTSPIGSNQNGSAYLHDLITCRSLNGATADYRTRNWNQSTEPDFFADELVSTCSQRYQGKDIVDDPVEGQDIPTNAVWPRAFKDTVFEVIDSRGTSNLKNIADTKAATVVQRETSPSTRMSTRAPLQPIDPLKQRVYKIDQVA